MRLWQVLVLSIFPLVQVLPGPPAAVPGQPVDEQFVIDSSQSRATFSIRHLGLNRVRGNFDTVNGTIVRKGSGDTLEVSIQIPVNSLDSGIGKRDRHLLSEDFFYEAEHPYMIFEGTAIADAETFDAHGRIIIRGVEKSVTFSVEQAMLASSSPEKRDQLLFTAKSTINRRDFGVDGGASGRLIGSKAKVSVSVVADLDSLNIE